MLECFAKLKRKSTCQAFLPPFIFCFGSFSKASQNCATFLCHSQNEKLTYPLAPFASQHLLSISRRSKLFKPKPKKSLITAEAGTILPCLSRPGTRSTSPRPPPPPWPQPRLSCLLPARASNTSTSSMGEAGRPHRSSRTTTATSSITISNTSSRVPRATRVTGASTVEALAFQSQSQTR